MIVRVACFSALGGLLFGYDLALIGAAILSLKESLQLSDSAQQAIVGAAKFGAVWGTFTGGACMLCYGRVKAIAISSIFFTIGPLIMAVSSGFWGLIAGRVVAGIGIGASAVVVPAYLGEMSRAQHRGAVVQVYEVALCLGMFLSTIIDYALQGVPGDWRWMVGLPALPGVLMGLATFCLPESPRWLALTGQPINHTGICEAQLAEIEHEMTMALQQQKTATWQQDDEQLQYGSSVVHPTAQRSRRASSTRSDPDSPAAAVSDSDTHSLLDAGLASTEPPQLGSSTVGSRPGFLPTLVNMLLDIVRVARGPERWALALALVLAFFNQATASSSVIMYAPSVLAHYHTPLNEAILLSSLVSVTKLLGVLTGMFTVDRFGRRPLLILGALACGVSHVGAMLGLASHSMAGTLGAFCLFIFSFSSSWAGGFWVLLSELFSLQAKSASASCATAFLFLTGSVVNLFFLTTIKVLGPFAFLVFASICFAASLFIWCSLPETKGKTLLEVQALLAAPRSHKFEKLSLGASSDVVFL